MSLFNSIFSHFLLQPLPNVDIDTSEGSSTTLVSSTFESPTKHYHTSSSPTKKTTFSPEKVDHSSPKKKLSSTQNMTQSPKKYPEVMKYLAP